MNNYLLELGVEEIPARFVDSSLEQLKDNIINKLKEERIEFEEVKTFSTPRRLTVIIKELSDRQEDKVEKLRGPSEKIGFENDKPTKALEGFMRGQGLTIDDIEIREFKGENYIFAEKKEKGKTTKELLKDIIPESIRNIHFTKAMKWGAREFRFIRPIRWIVSIYDGKILEFDFENIKVSNTTRGHRFLSHGDIVIDDIENYEEILKENFVIVDAKKRRAKILTQSDRLVKARGGKLDEDEDLMDEIVNLVEYPTPLIGEYNDEYLKLPKEVLITSMKSHQRYIPVLDDKNNLMPYFVTVRNGQEEHLDIVTKGNEKVLSARLEDARFFYAEDTKISLEDYYPRLENVVFQDDLGSIADKVRRMEELGQDIGENIGVGETALENIDRAIKLSKNDLVTDMVGEFAELQGVIGRIYAERSGESDIVSQAIYEQYLPRFATDILPESTAGMVVSITDKLDTITGLFAVGIKPTGSQDPFGLRRSALAILNIILDRHLKLDLSKMIDQALYIYIDKNALVFDFEKVKAEIVEFFNIRLKNILRDKGVRYDVVDAVITDDLKDIEDIMTKAEALESWLEEDRKEELEAFNRVSNLVKDVNRSEINTELFEEDEKALFDKYNELSLDIEKLIRNDHYLEALNELSHLEEYITRFFDNVMVMVEDEELKANRLALLKEIDIFIKRLGDISKIVI